MLDIYLTVDVEVWCNGWIGIDAKFPAAFKTYIYGSTKDGDYGLPYLTKVLNSHQLTGVFFVEPLFSCRFGMAPLVEIVQLLTTGNQEVQLHLHTEWVDEAKVPLLESVDGKRQHLRYFSLKEQVQLMRIGQRLLEEAGAQSPEAFRAGSFGLNQDTLAALSQCGIHIDSSYNATMMGMSSGISPGEPLLDVTYVSGIHEVPMTVFKDGFGKMRHTQLTACSFSELEGLLWRSLETGRQSFVVLMHNFELLNTSMNRHDPIVVKRFHQLCEFLDRNRDAFRVRGFKDWHASTQPKCTQMLSTPWLHTGQRVLEQALRRSFI